MTTLDWSQKKDGQGAGSLLFDFSIELRAELPTAEPRNEATLLLKRKPAGGYESTIRPSQSQSSDEGGSGSSQKDPFAFSANEEDEITINDTEENNCANDSEDLLLPLKRSRQQ